MTKQDDEVTEEYLAGCQVHLGTIEAALLAIEKGGGPEAIESAGTALRAARWIKGGADHFDLGKIGELAQGTEGALGLIRSGAMIPTRDRVNVLLRATDRLHELIGKPGTSEGADISAVMAALGALSESAAKAPVADRKLRMLLVEDDFASRLVLQTFLSRYGECHIAVNGREAVDAFSAATERGEVYDLICMDIMMPEMDGREAIRLVRAIEEERGVLSNRGARIIMTTTVEDIKEVIRCFRELCDAYLVKPIDLAELLNQMKSWEMVN